MEATKKNLKADFTKLIAQLENMILGGAFQPRERLPELKLANALGVSRAWVRDALKVLETRGLIKVVPYKGAIVCDLDEEEIEEIFDVRTHLEALAVRRAAANIQQKDIDLLKRMARQFEASIHRGDFGEMIAVNTSFHDHIMGLCQNRTLLQIIKQLQARCHILRYHGWSSPEVVERIQKEHDAFIESLKNKNFELLDELSKNHINYSKNSYVLHLRAKKANLTENRLLENASKSTSL